MTPEEIDPQLKHLLNELKPVPERSLQAAARGRARFLAEAARQSVSPKGIWRHTGQTNAFRKERFAMNVLVTTILALTMLFGGTVGTVYAAQDDLPNQALYPVKTFVEDVRLGLKSDPQGQLAYLGDLAQLRVQEMIALNGGGIALPPEVSLRLQQHNQQAMTVAAGMDDAAMPGALEQLRTRLQIQLITASKFQTQDQVMIQTRTMLQNQLRVVEDGLANPQGFRHAVRSQYQDQAFGTPNGTQSPGTGSGQGNGPANDGSGGGNGSGGSSNGTSDPGSGQGGYGPGGGQSTEAPGSGSGQGGYGPGGCLLIDESGRCIEGGSHGGQQGQGGPNRP